MEKQVKLYHTDIRKEITYDNVHKIRRKGGFVRLHVGKAWVSIPVEKVIQIICAPQKIADKIQEDREKKDELIKSIKNKIFRNGEEEKTGVSEKPSSKKDK